MDLPLTRESQLTQTLGSTLEKHKAYTRHNTTIKNTSIQGVTPRPKGSKRIINQLVNLKAATGINDHLIDLNLKPSTVLDSKLGKERELPIHR